MSKKPTIIEPSSIKENQINYSEHSYRCLYEFEEVVYYFDVHTEFFAMEDGLDFTGGFWVVLLHPLGLNTFEVTLDDNANFDVPEFIRAYVNSDLLALVLETIWSKKL